MLVSSLKALSRNLGTPKPELNPCDKLNGKCSHYCIKKEGGADCDCPWEMYLHYSGRRCAYYKLTVKKGLSSITTINQQILNNFFMHEFCKIWFITDI